MTRKSEAENFDKLMMIIAATKKISNSKTNRILRQSIPSLTVRIKFETISSFEGKRV